MSEFFLELFSEEIPAGLQKNLREKILEDFKNLFEKKLINLEAEVGPVKYIAALAVDWGVTDKVDTSEAVRWVILIIIFVFDPLAVLLLIAANISLRSRKVAKEENEAKIKKDYQKRK